ncbi:Gfo/Idh/MocA family protein [Microbacterium sp. YY-01]|uniref:Gfo/Idh/MocA family protein n=1 Tax=Microbacterium sp. YY-01 TaxID=3421634 RepID=UPI003D183586
MRSGVQLSPLVWAVVGLGTGGRHFHAPLLRAADGIDLAIAVGRDRDGLHRDFGAVEVVPDLAAARSAGAQAVTITTPAGTHEELAHEAIELGLHVVVDKPFALTATGAQGLIDHADRRGVLLSAFQNRRWDGDFLTVRSFVEDGSLGDIHRFYNRIQRFHPDLPAWNVGRMPEDGGGTLLDLVPHLVDQALVLLGPAQSVFAELRRVGGGTGGEDDVLMIIRHDSGAQSVIEASVAAATQGPRMQVNGSRGGVFVEGFDVQEVDLLAGRTPLLLGGDWGREPAERVVMYDRGDGLQPHALRAGEWTRLYPQFAAAVRGQAVVPVDPGDAVCTAQVIDAARVSASEGRWVVLV